MNPVISTTGPPINGNIGQASKGYLKVSPDGSMIASANNTDFTVGIYNFDNFTGTISHLVTDASYVTPGGGDPGGPYGVEFSPNSNRLYISEWKANMKISQYDLSSGDPTTILGSKTLVASLGQGSDPFGALQLGPDNRLYIARNGANYLSRINQPNSPGDNCGFVENAISLAGRNCRYGLPPFIQSFFHMTVDFYWDEPACIGYSTQFYASASDNPDSVKWTFPGGFTSTSMNPTFLFPEAKLYLVNLKVWLYGQMKTVNRFIQVGSNPVVSLGIDTTICANEAFFLDPGEYSSYLWQDGSTNPSILTDTTGWYWCEIANDFGCTAIDSAYITVNANPDVDAGPDLSIPEGESTTLEGSVAGGSGDYTYMWEPAALLENSNILQAVTLPMYITTTFTLTVTNNITGCVGTSEVLITVLGGLLTCSATASPLTVCSGGQTQLNALAYGGTGAFTYDWTSNPAGFISTVSNPVVEPGQTTTYTVSVYDGENTVTDNVVVTVLALPLAYAGIDQTITYSTTTILHGSATLGVGPYTYDWEPADKLVSANVQNPTTVNLYEPTVFRLFVSDLGTGCINPQPDLVSVSVDGSALSVVPSAEPATTCSGEPVHLFSGAGGGTTSYTYTWTSNPSGFTSTEEQPVVSPLVNTVYTVNVNDGVNNLNANVVVTVNQLPVINLIPLNDPKIQIISPTEIGVCVFDSVTLNAGNIGSEYLWSDGTEGQTITIHTSGISIDSQEYWVEVNNPITTCSNRSNIKANFTFNNCSYGIDEKDSGSHMQVYPNPSYNGAFNYLIEGLSGKATIEIFTSQGKLIYAEEISLLTGNTYKSNFMLRSSVPGVYYLRLTNNDVVIQKKLIIQ